MVQPQEVFIGDPVKIKVEGGTGGELVTISISGTDQFGNIWESRASYRLDSSGAMDTASSPPLQGTYSGVDPAGLFWSMRCQPQSDMVSPFIVMPELEVSLIHNGKVIETKKIVRVASVDMERYEFKIPVIGVFLKPKELNKPSPALIVLDGSEGGYKEGWAKIIASRVKMPTLAIALFRNGWIASHS